MPDVNVCFVSDEHDLKDLLPVDLLPADDDLLAMMDDELTKEHKEGAGMSALIQ